MTYSKRHIQAFSFVAANCLVIACQGQEPLAAQAFTAVKPSRHVEVSALTSLSESGGSASPVKRESGRLPGIAGEAGLRIRRCRLGRDRR